MKKNITITDNLAPSLNLIRLAMITKIEDLKEVVKISKNFSLKSQNKAKQDLDNFTLLYNKFFN